MVIHTRRAAALCPATRIAAFGLLFLPCVVLAQGTPAAAVKGKDAPAWTVNVAAGFASTFQMVLGSTFGQGYDVQDRLTIGVSDALLRGDSVNAFGWSTTDLASTTPNWQAGLLYKVPIVRRKNQGALTHVPH